jgi:hypothetical protein
VARQTIYAENLQDMYSCFFIRAYLVGKMLWRETPENWKWAYGKVEMEAQRTTTCESEIVESYWKFTVRHFFTYLLTFLQYTNGLSSYNYPIFEANHTLIQPDIFPEPLTWNLLPGGYFTVTRIPPLHISRNRSTWAWTISNAFCLYVAVEHPGMEKQLFGGAIGDCEGLDEEEDGGFDDVDEAAERRGAMPRRGDGGWVGF